MATRGSGCIDKMAVSPAKTVKSVPGEVLMPSVCIKYTVGPRMYFALGYTPKAQESSQRFTP